MHFVYRFDTARNHFPPDFEPHVVGVRDPNRPRIIERHHSPAERSFLLLMHGPGMIDGQWIESPHLILKPPGTSHAYGNADASWENSWMTCRGDRLLTLFDELRLPIDAPFATAPSPFEQFLGALRDEVSLHAISEPRILQNLLENLCLDLRRQLHPPASTLPTPQWLLEVKRSIELHYRSECSLADLAGNAGCSTYHLTRQFRKAFGVSAIRYLIEVRMGHACELLAYPEIPITEVAELTGYTDLFTFSKAFKTMHGMSPTAYRAECIAAGST